MNKLFLMLFLIVCINVHAGITIPKLHFVHSETLDYISCPKDDVKSEWKTEIQEKTQTIQMRWRNTFQWLVADAMGIINKSYPVLDIQINIFACSRIKEADVLFQRNLRPHLSENSAPRSLDLFMDGVFREFYRSYIGHIAGVNLTQALSTPLITKYRELGENEAVLSELHLLAVQKYIYIWKGNQQLLDQVVQEAKNTNSNRARAWQILENEDFRVFVNELKRLK